MAQCAQCRQDNPEQARFCRACGAELAAARGGAARAGGAPPVPTEAERARRLLEEAFRLSEQGRIQAAISACQQAINTNPNSTSAHSLLGTLYERQGDRESAIREYEQVLTLSPGSTVERRRLNELMGVPAAREAVAISARGVRFAVSGAFIVVVLVLVSAILFTTQRQPPARPPAMAAGVASRGFPGEQAMAPQMIVPAPGRMFPVQAPLPRPAPLQIAGFTPAPASAQPGAARWVAPGTYLLPSGGGERYQGLTSPGGVRPRSATYPFARSVRVPGRTTPRIATPQRRISPGLVPRGAVLNPGLGRNYYFRGDYQRAAEVYEAYLYDNPVNAAPVREELGWVYLESGDYNRATQQYQAAHTEYRADLNRGHNVEAARHGLRTCDSALDVLDTR